MVLLRPVLVLQFLDRHDDPHPHRLAVEVIPGKALVRFHGRVVRRLDAVLVDEEFGRAVNIEGGGHRGFVFFASAIVLA